MPRQVQRRIAKACERCRRKKARCDGQLPCCSGCSQDAVSCIYRDRVRVRQSHRRGAPEQPSSSVVDANDSIPDSSGHGRSGAPQAVTGPGNGRMAASREDYSNDAFVGVNAAQSRCELYYGSSSIFAFLQNIHQTFHDPDGEAADRGDQDQGMRRFQHEDRFFTSEQLSRTNPDEGKSRYALLPESLARQFLDIYIKSLHYLMPWSSGIDLVHMLDMMYSPEVEKQLQMPKGDTAVTLLALACGATFFKHSGWIDVLVERALAQVPRLEVVINLKSVQISLLLAHVLVCCGRHNSAYLYLGSAVRKAFAAGLHKNIDYPVANRQNPGDRAEVRRLTFWSLAFFERWFSFWQGRPSAIDGILVSRPLPETSPLVKALAELSDIVVQAGHRIYDNVCPQLTKLWEAAQHVRFELLSFQKRMRPLLGFDLDDETQLLDGHPVQVFLINCERGLCAPPCFRTADTRQSTTIRG